MGVDANGEAVRDSCLVLSGGSANLCGLEGRGRDFSGTGEPGVRGTVPQDAQLACERIVVSLQH